MPDRKAYLWWCSALVLWVGGCLGGCAKSELLIDERPCATFISTSLRSYTGAKAVLADGLKLGITSETPDEYVEFNLPYTLKNGVLLPDETALMLPDGELSVHLSAYGPYTPGSEEGRWRLTYDRVSLIKVAFNFGVQTDQRTVGTASSDLILATGDYSGPTTKTHLTFEHRCAQIKIRLTSELGNDLSDAQVTLLGIYTGGQLNFYNQEFTLSTSVSEPVTTFALPDGSYEAIIPPQKLKNQAFARVEVGGKSYTFHTSGEKLLEAGKEYLFELKVKDKGDLPFTIALTCDNKPLGDRLAIGSKAVRYPIEMTEIPNPGKEVTNTKLKIRNANGQPCWANIRNDLTVSYDPDLLYDQVRGASIAFDENLSPDPRTMVLEFYNTSEPKFVHKRVLVEQAGATEYFTLSAPGLTIDRWGDVYNNTPTPLTVHSNQGWTLENSVPDWVSVEGYTAGNRNQELRLTVKENTTGGHRTGELRFMVGGTVAQTYRIEQNTTEDASFTLRYELNLRYTTTDNKFKASHQQVGEYCVSTLIVFAKYETSSDAAVEVSADAPYGYVADAPASFNRVEINKLRSDYFIYPNYTKKASVLSGVNSTLLGPQNQGRLSFFRQLIFDLPIPPNVRRDQKVVYTVTINNVQDTAAHDKAVVTYELIDQKPR